MGDKRRILVTALKWSSDREATLSKALLAAQRKYGSAMTVVVGYTAPGLKIAHEAVANGFSVQMYAPDIKVLTSDHIEVMGGITITSSAQGDYLRYLVHDIDAVMAFDKGDPLVLTASRQDKPVWFPSGT